MIERYRNFPECKLLQKKKKKIVDEYEKDISETLYSPKKKKKCKNGTLRPSKHEQWLDVQARALIQAEKLIKDCVEF